MTNQLKLCYCCLEQQPNMLRFVDVQQPNWATPTFESTVLVSAVFYCCCICMCSCRCRCSRFLLVEQESLYHYVLKLSDQILQYPISNAAGRLSWWTQILCHVVIFSTPNHSEADIPNSKNLFEIQGVNKKNWDKSMYIGLHTIEWCSCCRLVACTSSLGRPQQVRRRYRFIR